MCTDANGNYVPCGDTGNSDPTTGGGRGSVVLLPDQSKPWSTGGYSGIPMSAGFENKQYNVGTAQAYFMRLTSDERSRLEKLYKEIGPTLGVKKSKSLWYMAVDAAADSGMTPWQIMEQTAAQVKAGNIQPDPNAGGTGGGGGPFYSKTVNLTNPEDAKILVQNALSQYLGRNATDDEIATFTKSLRSEEQASPQISQGYAGNRSRDTVNSGGVSPAQAADMAKDYAQSRPDYAEFQAGTNLLDAFIGVLENKGRVV